MNYTDSIVQRDKNNKIAGLMVHGMLSQTIDSHCFDMQLLTTTFIFTIIHEEITSENRQRQW